MNDEITVDELKHSLKKVVLVDVRELEEYTQGSLPGAMHKPLGELIRDTGKGIFVLPRDKEIVCYCAAGVRGKIAVDFLRTKGVKARNLIGGYYAWKDKN